MFEQRVTVTKDIPFGTCSVIRLYRLRPCNKMQYFIATKGHSNLTLLRYIKIAYNDLRCFFQHVPTNRIPDFGIFQYIFQHNAGHLMFS